MKYRFSHNRYPKNNSIKITPHHKKTRLRRSGLDAAIAAHVAADKPTLAICGGLQILGSELKDPHGVEGSALGLGLLPYTTEFLPVKQYRHGSYTLAPLAGYWGPLSGLTFDGYEIHHGITQTDGDSAPRMRAVLSENMGWQQGQTIALYPHGLFENSRAMRSLFGLETPTLDDTMNGLADFIDAHFAKGALMSLVK